MLVTSSLAPRATAAAEIVRAARERAWQLEADLTLSEWSDEHRILSSVSSAEPGHWRTARTPYLREIMDLLSSNSDCNELCLMKGGQIGGSEVLLNWISYVIATAPAPMLVVQPTLDLLKKFTKQRLHPAIESTPEIRGALDEGEQTLFTMEYEGGILMLTTARSASGLSSMPIARLACDEVDRYPGDVGGEGDPIELAKRRTATFWNRKCAYVSTPRLRGDSRIERLYESSDQRRYFIPCPECGHMDFLTWTGFRDFIRQEDPGHHRIGWEEGSPERAFMVCGNDTCKARIEESSKSFMLERGEWRALSPGPGKMPGFHLSALYSPLGWYSWGEAAEMLLKVKRNPLELQTWVNTVLGESWEEKGESVGWKALKNRIEPYPERDGEQLVPRGVGAIVIAVDVQGDRLEWYAWGYGVGEESWLLAFGSEPGDPAKDQVWLALDRQLTSTFPHESGRELPIDCVTIDSGGQHPEQVYKFCRTRLLDGRKVYPVKGGSRAGVPIVSAPSRGNSYKVPLYVLCTDTAKELLFSRMQILDVGPGYIHFPQWTAGDDEIFLQLTAEKARRHWVKGRMVREWTKSRDRNEALDCLVYALAGLYILGNGRCPGWLAERANENSRPPASPVPAPENPGVRIPEALRRRRGNWVTGRGGWRP